MGKLTGHQLKQIEVIKKIEKLFNQNKISAVSKIDDYENDPRICLTSVHFPSKKLTKIIVAKIIEPLQKIDKNIFYYPPESLHLTVKNIRTINNPPDFKTNDLLTAKKVFSKVIPKLHKFKIYYYKLVIYPNSLSIVYTTDPELDLIFSELDKALNKSGLPDNKFYANNKYIISNITLARFYGQPTPEFKNEVKRIAKLNIFDNYIIDSVTLLTANAAMKNKKIIGKWKLQ
ncbi:MAG TPA: hypothetical protein VI795_02810 [Patescibacteria group bacterium]|nr:hypothetical protein [Patescibacteria group bacterium]